MTTRRQLIQSSLTLGAMQLFPGITQAQAKRLVFATFTGSWEEAHRAVLVPAYRAATKAEITLDPMLPVDQIAKGSACPLYTLYAADHLTGLPATARLVE